MMVWGIVFHKKWAVHKNHKEWVTEGINKDVTGWMVRGCDLVET